MIVRPRFACSCSTVTGSFSFSTNLATRLQNLLGVSVDDEHLRPECGRLPNVGPRSALLLFKLSTNSTDHFRELLPRGVRVKRAA